MAKNLRLGDLLIMNDLVTKEQLDKMLAIQKTNKKKLGEVFISEGFGTEETLLEMLKNQFEVDLYELNTYPVNKTAVKRISEALARKHSVIPIDMVDGKLLLIMSDPLNYTAIEDVKLVTRSEIEVGLASEVAIKRAITKYYDVSAEAESAAEEISTSTGRARFTDRDAELEDDVRNSPTVRLVNALILQALRERASDIHIEPLEDEVRVRIRVDGTLKDMMTIEKQSHPSIVTRIKIVGKLDISERRVPQDGRVDTEIDDQHLDMRISTFPTVHGEKVVIRLLSQTHVELTKEAIGLRDYALESVNKLLKSPEGMLLVTGPTGSGKTTTLYTLLSELNTKEKNIITVEDPVEYKLRGINQGQVNVKSGLTFAAGLRSILRQDPDIVMIGEIRDVETAEIAIRASITGHFVLSTLHTNDTASTVSRLLDMGIDSFLLSSALKGIISQRLVKKLCEYCKTEHKLTADEKTLIALPPRKKVYKGVGCPYCNHTGYLGRTSVHEVLRVDKAIRSAIDKKQTSDEIRDIAIQQGMVTLFESGRQLVLNGETSIDELLRIGYSLDSD